MNFLALKEVSLIAKVTYENTLQPNRRPEEYFQDLTISPPKICWGVTVIARTIELSILRSLSHVNNNNDLLEW